MELTQGDYESLQINWTLAAIAFTLLIYDHILTFTYEVERFWPWWLRTLLDFKLQPHDPSLEDNSNGRSDTTTERGDECRSKGYACACASLLFFLNRYLTLLGHAPVMMEYFWRIRREDMGENTYVYLTFLPDIIFILVVLSSRCKYLQVYHQFLVVAIQAIIACLLIMRIYALYERRKWVAVLYAAISCFAVGTAIWAIINSKQSGKSPRVAIPYGCGETLASDEAFYLAMAWLGELVFDTLIFGMTLYKALTLPRVGGIGLLTVLMRDGTIYFGVMVVTNIGNILTFILGGPLSRGSLTMFTNVISSIMISRLMLNLRDPKLHLYGSGGGYSKETTMNPHGIYGRDDSWNGVMTTIAGDSRILANSPVSSSDTRWDTEA